MSNALVQQALCVARDVLGARPDDSWAVRVQGAVSHFERASFFDPLADLAHTLRNATYHRPTGARELLAAYGIDQAGRRRMAVHHLLHTLAERIWIGDDRPTGWRNSVDRLDAELHRAVRRT